MQPDDLEQNRGGPSPAVTGAAGESSWAWPAPPGAGRGARKKTSWGAVKELKLKYCKSRNHIIYYMSR